MFFLFVFSNKNEQHLRFEPYTDVRLYNYYFPVIAILSSSDGSDIMTVAVIVRPRLYYISAWL